MSDTEIKTTLQRLQNDALSRGDHKLLLRAAGVSQDWARGFLSSAHVSRFLGRELGMISDDHQNIDYA